MRGPALSVSLPFSSVSMWLLLQILGYSTPVQLSFSWLFSLVFLIYLLIMLLQLSHFCPFTQLHPAHPLPPTFPPYSSCPWIILISSLASTFPTLSLPSPCLFCTYQLCFFFWYIYWLCYYSCSISAPSLNSILPTPSLPHSPPIVHVHGSYL